MRLGVTERIALLQILPQQGDFLTLRIIHELRQALSFTEEETAEFGLEVDAASKTVRWREDQVKEVEIPIGPKANTLIVATLIDWDKRSQLTENHLSLYEKFIVSDE